MAKRLYCSVESWVPRQIHTSLRLLKNTDYYEQMCLKFSAVGQFHSRAELLHVALLEGNANVKRYVPQPHRFRVGSKSYIPDCFVETDRLVIRELKPRGDFDEQIFEHVFTLCRLHNVVFEVISNEEVYEQELLAENWLTILRTLIWAKDIDTNVKENQVIESLATSPSFFLGDYVEVLDREHSYLSEIAIMRLLHRGVLSAELTDKRIGYDTLFEIAS